MNHSHARPLQGDWQSSEKALDHFPNRIVRQNLRHGRAVLRAKFVAKIPSIVVLPMVQQDIQVVIAKHALGPPRFHQHLNQPNNRRTIRPAIRQIANKHKPPAIPVRAMRIVPEMLHEERKSLDFAMHIADDIDRAVEERLDGRWHRFGCNQQRNGTAEPPSGACRSRRGSFPASVVDTFAAVVRRVLQPGMAFRPLTDICHPFFVRNRGRRR